MGTRSHQDGHQHVVVGVADVVALGLLADDQRARVQARHQVCGPKNQSLHPWHGRDRVNVHQTAGVFDLRVDSDLAHWKSVDRFQLGQQQVERLNM